MLLTRLIVCNFRSLRRVAYRFQRLAVLIGENDAGKSSTLDLLEMLLGSRRPDENDFFAQMIQPRSEDHQAEPTPRRSIPIVAYAVFALSDHETHLEPFAHKGAVIVRKCWHLDRTEAAFWSDEIADPDLAQDFDKLKKAELTDVIERLSPGATGALKTNPERKAWLKDRAASADRVRKWAQMPRVLADALPRFERYRAMDYANPGALVLKTLRQVYDQVIYEDVGVDGQKTRRLDKRLEAVKTDAEQRIRTKVQELDRYVRRYAPQIRGVSYDPIIDFSGGLSGGELQVDTGRGLHYFSKLGDGTKRRIFMATTEWDRASTLQQIQSGTAVPAVLRGYDEPDTNLHYEAQRRMYQAIADIAAEPNSNTQMLVCTHSLAMIDRAPARSINLLRLRSGCTTVSRLETDGDAEIERFLEVLAGEMGITNSVMFYERCFVLIEGDTEANALPLMYRALFGRSLLEDGIRLIPVHGSGATGEFLRLLSKNRQQLTVVFVDRDTQTEMNGKVAKLTRDALKQSGFSDAFIQDRVLYIGDKEFEDAFSDAILAEALNHGYRKSEGQWEAAEVTALRNEKKLSDALRKAVHETPLAGAPRWGKPELGKCLGHVCRSRDQTPADIQNLFDQIRRVACCED